MDPDLIAGYHHRTNRHAPSARILRNESGYSWINAGARPVSSDEEEEECILMQDGDTDDELMQQDADVPEGNPAAEEHEEGEEEEAQSEDEESEQDSADMPPRIPRRGEELIVDWQQFELGNRGPRTPRPYLLARDDGSWEAVILAGPEDPENDLAVAWLAGRLGTEPWRISIHAADEEVEEYYQADNLAIAYALPTLQQLAGGGKKRRVTLRSRSRTPPAGARLKSEVKQDDEESTAPLIKREADSDEPPLRDAFAEGIGEQDTSSGPFTSWLLPHGEQMRCLPCRKWATPEHLASVPHAKMMAWLLCSRPEERQAYVQQKKEAFLSNMSAKKEAGEGGVQLARAPCHWWQGTPAIMFERINQQLRTNYPHLQQHCVATRVEPQAPDQAQQPEVRAPLRAAKENQQVADAVQRSPQEIAQRLKRAQEEVNKMEAECEMKRRKLERRVDRNAQQGHSGSSSSTMAMHTEGTSARAHLHHNSTASSSARGGQASSRAVGSTEGASSSSKGASSRVQHAGVAAGPHWQKCWHPLGLACAE